MQQIVADSYSGRLTIRSGSLVVLFVFIAYVSYRKGMIAEIQGWGVFNWWVTYGHGFIKRGLLGTLFQVAAAGLSQDAQRVLVLNFYGFSSAGFIALIGCSYIGLYRRCLSPKSATALSIVLLLFLASQFLPTIAYITGYLDVYLFTLLCLSLLAACCRYYFLAGALAMLAPFIHEAFIFLWLIAVLLLLWDASNSPPPPPTHQVAAGHRRSLRRGADRVVAA